MSGVVVESENGIPETTWLCLRGERVGGATDIKIACRLTLRIYASTFVLARGAMGSRCLSRVGFSQRPVVEGRELRIVIGLSRTCTGVLSKKPLSLGAK